MLLLTILVSRAQIIHAGPLRLLGMPLNAAVSGKLIKNVPMAVSCCPASFRMLQSARLWTGNEQTRHSNRVFQLDFRTPLTWLASRCCWPNSGNLLTRRLLGLWDRCDEA